MDIGPTSSEDLRFKLSIVPYQLFNIACFLAGDPAGEIMMQFLMGGWVKKWRNTSDLTPQMNYSYAYMWWALITGRVEELQFKIDLNACPTFFAYGNEPMTFFPDL